MLRVLLVLAIASGIAHADVPSPEVSSGDGGTWRIVIGVIVAVLCVGGGVWFARRKPIKP